MQKGTNMDYLKYWWEFLILIGGSYMAGSISASTIISKKVKKQDIRQFGSRNPGTTNMARVFGFKFGVITFLFDFLKGFACASLSKIVFTSLAGAEIGLFAAYLSGLFIILGHNYSVFLRFHGGKGFAAAIGIYMAVNPGFTAILLLIGVLMLIAVDRMSICAITFFFVEALYCSLYHLHGCWWVTLFTILYLILGIISHRSNIARLMKGEEKELGIRKKIHSRLGNS